MTKRQTLVAQCAIGFVAGSFIGPPLERMIGLGWAMLLIFCMGFAFGVSMWFAERRDRENSERPAPPTR